MFTLAFDRQNQVLLGRFRGVFSSEDIAGFDAAVMTLVSREGPARAIVDFCPVEAWAVPISKLIRRAQQPAISPGYRRVFIIQRPDFAEAMRTYAVQQELAGTDPPFIVSTFDEALQVLNLVEPDFQLVEES